MAKPASATEIDRSQQPNLQDGRFQPSLKNDAMLTTEGLLIFEQVEVFPLLRGGGASQEASLGFKERREQ